MDAIANDHANRQGLNACGLGNASECDASQGLKACAMVTRTDAKDKCDRQGSKVCGMPTKPDASDHCSHQGLLYVPPPLFSLLL
jgi:hypothetical protein